MRRFVADDWPMKIWMALVCAAWLVGVVRVARSYAPLHWKEVVLLLLIAATTFFIAAGIGLLLGAVFVPPIYLFQARRNGAPFEPGDEVRILTGPARGRVVRVYATRENHSVRVDLGEEAKQSLEDIYDPYQVERVSAVATP